MDQQLISLRRYPMPEGFTLDTTKLFSMEKTIFIWRTLPCSTLFAVGLVSLLRFERDSMYADFHTVQVLGLHLLHLGCQPGVVVLALLQPIPVHRAPLQLLDWGATLRSGPGDRTFSFCAWSSSMAIRSCQGEFSPFRFVYRCWLL